MASSSRGLLTLFPDLNESTRERTGAVALEPQPSAPEFAPLNFPMRSVEQRMALQSDVEANQYTLKSCVETMTAVTNLSNRLQSRTNEVQQLNSQLALLQRMYKDARAEISVLRAENKELKRKATVMFRFGGPPYAAVEEYGGVNVLGGVENTKAAPSRAVQDGGKKKRLAADKAGQADAIAVSHKLQQLGWIPELILSSDAVRTKETLKTMQEQVRGFLEAEVHFISSFYSIAAMDGQTAEHLQHAICKFSRDEILTVM
ncbi:hypothetical protein TEA_010643 [Camellia sinensis var. sinensis]|uniref:Uncharacterized protein n=1 Tax=Camellia sinensis var. sinensis TaxID=542762 RepID=A0A4S4D8R2_CAMSN|nr:hypothetical protein TEA_010643 [Camellia sinensis var. sinensis]